MEERHTTSNTCELIYTFVIGGGNPDGPTELVDDSLPILVVADHDDDKRNNNTKNEDLNMDDITLLNIQENMEDGKSQNWMYYASLVMEEFDNNDNTTD